MGVVTSRAIDAWRRGPLSRRPLIRGSIKLDSRVDVPLTLPRQRLMLIGEPSKWAVMTCPCGRGHDINLNLANAGAPQWRVTDTRRPSLSPSIDVQDPAGRCHFWLRNGRVHWVQRPSARAPVKR